jgi:hypothetical protein
MNAWATPRSYTRQPVDADIPEPRAQSNIGPAASFGTARQLEGLLRRLRSTRKQGCRDSSIVATPIQPVVRVGSGAGDRRCGPAVRRTSAEHVADEAGCRDSSIVATPIRLVVRVGSGAVTAAADQRCAGPRCKQTHHDSVVEASRRFGRPRRRLRRFARDAGCSGNRPGCHRQAASSAIEAGSWVSTRTDKPATPEICGVFAAAHRVDATHSRPVRQGRAP